MTHAASKETHPTVQVSAVLGSYNRLAFLRAAVESTRDALADLPHEIIVVDGGSTDGSLAWLARQKDIVTIVQHNRGQWRGKPVKRRSWGYFMNLGFKCAQGRYVLMISDDCLLLPGAVSKGVEHLEALASQGRRIGAGAFYWRNWPEDKDYRVGLTLGDKMFVNHGLYLRAALAEVGYVEESRYSFYHADGDLCLKLWQAGYETVDCPESYAEHFMHVNTALRSGNNQRQQEDWRTYLDHWTGIFYDPALKNDGGWLWRSMDDPAQTAYSFPAWRRILLQGKAVGMLRAAARTVRSLSRGSQ